MDGSDQITPTPNQMKQTRCHTYVATPIYLVLFVVMCKVKTIIQITTIFNIQYLIHTDWLDELFIKPVCGLKPESSPSHKKKAQNSSFWYSGAEASQYSSWYNEKEVTFVI